MTQTEALRVARDAMNAMLTYMGMDEDEWNKGTFNQMRKAITNIEEALAQPEQELVAMRHSFDGYGYKYTDMGFGGDWIGWTRRQYKDAERLYTAPPQRTWVGLTDEEVKKIAYNTAERKVAKDIEAKLKEKNT